MPDKHRNQHSETTPHSDGQFEGIINDSQGSQIGITVRAHSGFHHERNPFHAKLKEKEAFKAIDQFINGSKQQSEED